MRTASPPACTTRPRSTSSRRSPSASAPRSRSPRPAPGRPRSSRCRCSPSCATTRSRASPGRAASRWPTAPEPVLDSHRMEGAKAAAVEQWTADPCGSDRVAGEPGTREYFEDLLRARQAYAPWMSEELDYAGAAGQDVLDVGCGQGIDVASYALAGANATGVDLTPRHVELAAAHTAALGLRATVVQGDAESLPFEDARFDRA